MKVALLKRLYLCSGKLGRFSRQDHRKIDNLSLLEPVSGNFNSLMSQKHSLFLLSLDGPLRRAKRSELYSMPWGAMLERAPKNRKFPVKLPVSREFGSGERFARDSIHRQYLESIKYSHCFDKPLRIADL
jgi:hypothetical protein